MFTMSSTTELKMWQELRVDQVVKHTKHININKTKHDNLVVTSKTKSYRETDRITIKYYNNYAEITGSSIWSMKSACPPLKCWCFSMDHFYPDHFLNPQACV